jgi:hypothetical protein
MLDILSATAATNVVTLSVRVAMVLGMFLLGWGFYKKVKNNIEVAKNTPDKFAGGMSLRAIAIGIMFAVFVFTFQTSPYTPKLRVVEQSSTEMEQQYVERNSKILEEGVKPSEADAKAAARKNDTNIREKFEQLPDK